MESSTQKTGEGGKRPKTAEPTARQQEEGEEPYPQEAPVPPPPADAANSQQPLPPTAKPILECRRFSSPQGCPFGDSCRYSHTAAPAPTVQPSTAAHAIGNDDCAAGEKEPVSSSSKKQKPCTRFFSTLGCPYGDSCHFSHYSPGGTPAVTVTSVGTSGTKRLGGFLSAVTTKRRGCKRQVCSQFGTPEGCKFGDKCHFAHGEEEMCKHVHDAAVPQSIKEGSCLELTAKEPSGRDDGAQQNVRLVSRQDVSVKRKPAADLFGAATKAIFIVDASLVGAIIGKSGVHTKQISKLTGAKLCIHEHESDPNLRNVEMEGSFEQIKLAGQMVKELLMHNDSLSLMPSWVVPHSHSYKIKSCVNYPLGTCKFGNRCFFAHAIPAERTEPSV